MGRTIKFLALAASLSAALAAAPAEARGGWQCVTYARTITDVSIRGNANTWWGQAAGRYERGKTPTPGAVLAFKSIPGMRAGHVAVVKDIVSDRELVIDHANWTRRGGVEHNARVIDVSDAGDWSAVKVSFGNGMGSRVNPTFGFIYPAAGERVAAPVYASAVKPTHRLAPLGVEIAMLARAEMAGGN
ncbi:CHAP domain-containing protein [Sphingomonas sp. SUN039]|uniref:CHAP domain-containing protein n=1 Tax=Sphingomonas sp. SUN039 TaxID=2937787 RepID=UPI0021648274|nr:CHAP domain-containing protein [Sphingomonas sp. SUN039]UVO54569.1 CHAP domain-containing protein [Sphingomonas sp. SUN039]